MLLSTEQNRLRNKCNAVYIHYRGLRFRQIDRLQELKRRNFTAYDTDRDGIASFYHLNIVSSVALVMSIKSSVRYLVDATKPLAEVVDEIVKKCRVLIYLIINDIIYYNLIYCM